MDRKASSVEREAAMNDGIAKSDGQMAKCFWPRHVLHTVENGKDVDYIICFQCKQVVIVRDGQRKTVPITREPQALFDKYLKDADIPLAPG